MPWYLEIRFFLRVWDKLSLEYSDPEPSHLEIYDPVLCTTIRNNAKTPLISIILFIRIYT